MILVRQRFARDCGICAIAMATNHSWEQVAMYWGDKDFNKEGIYEQGLDSYLADHDFASRKMSKYRGTGFGEMSVRETWPVAPFAEVQICHGLAFIGAAMTHFWCMDGTGHVFDGLFPERTLLDCYPEVYSIRGIYKVV